jgi:hypothetical protein
LLLTSDDYNKRFVNWHETDGAVLTHPLEVSIRTPVDWRNCWLVAGAQTLAIERVQIEYIQMAAGGEERWLIRYR